MRRTEEYLKSEEPSPPTLLEESKGRSYLLKVLNLNASWDPSNLVFKGSSPKYFIKGDNGALMEHGGLVSIQSFESTMVHAAKVVSEVMASPLQSLPESWDSVKPFDPLGLFDDFNHEQSLQPLQLPPQQQHQHQSTEPASPSLSPRQQRSMSIPESEDEEGGGAGEFKAKISLNISALSVAPGEVVAVVGQV
jgi:hypothetical protein